MNVYYTAKDIEEMAANGTKELVLGPGVFLTDYARETAKQFNITLIWNANQQDLRSMSPPVTDNRQNFSNKYNKPSGCQHGSNVSPAAPSQSIRPSNQAGNEADSNTVDKLVNLMGKVIKRGG
jgi:hypothetical protein